MDASLESGTTYSRKVVKTTVAGSGIEAMGGAVAVVLAILGLAGLAPEDMMTVSAIVVGAALLAQAGFMAVGASDVASSASLGRRDKVEFEGGISAEALAGCAAIVLGILALIGFDATVLIAVAAIVLGAGLVLESGAMSRLNRMGEGGELATRRAVRRAVAGTEGAQVLVGLAAIVLGILALIGLSPMVLNLVAMLAIGASILLSGAALGGKLARLLTTTS